MTGFTFAMIFCWPFAYIVLYGHSRQHFTIDGYRLSGSANKKMKSIKSKWTFTQRLFHVHFFTSQCKYKYKYKIIAILDYCHLIFSIALLSVFFSNFQNYEFCKDLCTASMFIALPTIIIRYLLPCVADNHVK